MKKLLKISRHLILQLLVGLHMKNMSLTGFSIIYFGWKSFEIASTHDRGPQKMIVKWTMNDSFSCAIGYCDMSVIKQTVSNHSFTFLYCLAKSQCHRSQESRIAYIYSLPPMHCQHSRDSDLFPNIMMQRMVQITGYSHICFHLCCLMLVGHRGKIQSPSHSLNGAGYLSSSSSLGALPDETPLIWRQSTQLWLSHDHSFVPCL